MRRVTPGKRTAPLGKGRIGRVFGLSSWPILAVLKTKDCFYRDVQSIGTMFWDYSSKKNRHVVEEWVWAVYDEAVIRTLMPRLFCDLQLYLFRSKCHKVFFMNHNDSGYHLYSPVWLA